MEHASQPHQPEGLTSAQPTNAASTGSYPERLWHTIATRRRESTPVTTAALRELLCRTAGISSDAAAQRLEAHARCTGLIRVGDQWFTTVPAFLLPPMSRDAYERVVRALKRHMNDCDCDRVRHGAAGNHGAARALESEVAATERTLQFIETLTTKLA